MSARCPSFLHLTTTVARFRVGSNLTEFKISYRKIVGLSSPGIYTLIFICFGLGLYLNSTPNFFAAFTRANSSGD